MTGNLRWGSSARYLLRRRSRHGLAFLGRNRNTPGCSRRLVPGGGQEVIAMSEESSERRQLRNLLQHSRLRRWGQILTCLFLTRHWPTIVYILMRQRRPRIVIRRGNCFPLSVLTATAYGRPRTRVNSHLGGASKPLTQLLEISRTCERC